MKMIRVLSFALSLVVVSALFHASSAVDAQIPGPCTAPVASPVACENTLPGNPASEWDISGAGDATIQGFATDISVNRGQTVRFKVDTAATSYRLDIYRLGYYGGNGARKVATVLPSAPLPQLQPPCASDPLTGLVDCGVWSESASWSVPASAVSGIYLAKLVRTDATPGASHVVFVVRDDTGGSDLLFQTSDTTWQAYNRFGGSSLYTGSPAGRAYKVSYNRPFTTRAYAPEDWLFNAEYPMVRWLERNGFDVSYSTGVDTDRRGAELLEHRVFLSVGHDEYWSGAQRANVEAARGAGVHLGFFSGNEVFWKTRWEPSIDGAGTDYRTLVCYKETHANAKIDPEPGVWTGTWRDARFSPPADGGRPENALTGTIFTVTEGTSAIEVPFEYSQLRLWRNTSIVGLAPGTSAMLAGGTLGYEWDEALVNGAQPAGLIRLSHATRSVPGKLQDLGSTYAPGTATHSLTMYRDGAALVFGAGTVQWSWGLDAWHDRTPSTPDVRMQQATINLLADMGIQPVTPQPGVVVASASTDVTPPTSAITAPSGGATVPQGIPVVITGTAADLDGVVAGVEVSTDGGASWHPAAGTLAWSLSWTPAVPGPTTIFARAVDDSGNVQLPGSGVAITVGAAPAPTCPCSLWEDTTVPSTVDAGPDNPVELGVQFRASSDGLVTGVRFYKSAANIGPHVGTLWTSTGTPLASVTFANETASGWQTAALAAPVAITAGTTYVVSYHTTVGHYAFTSSYFSTSAHTNGALEAPATTDTPNGVFRYGAAGGFPNSTYRGSNYWVDVVFASTAVDQTAPAVRSTSPAADSPAAPRPAEITATFSEALDPSSVAGATFRVTDALGADVPGSVSYNAGNRSAVFTPTAPLSYLTTYSAVVRGGASAPHVQDAAGNPLAADFSWTFTIGAAPPPPPHEGPGGPILVVADPSNPFSRYYAEILRAEGLNAFAVADLGGVTADLLVQFDLVVLGNVPLSAAQAAMFGTWVSGGGRLIAMRPDKQLAGLLGLSDAGATLSDQYLKIQTATAAGAGLVGETIQFHGTADLYTVSGATVVATLYSSATTATVSPAVTLASAGTGQAAAFTYDLARSVVYTRQGNPAWAGQDRDGQTPIRANDLFIGGTEPDWVNLDKVAIPQADEQMRLFAQLVLQMMQPRQPMPRFWYFPHGHKAIVIMTGDDHANGGTAARFDQYLAASPQGCSVDDWECIRGTSYIYRTTPMSDAEAAQYEALGFEVGLHATSFCSNYDAASLAWMYPDQIAAWQAEYPSVPAPSTMRMHCIVWSDYSSQPAVQLDNGIRLDTSYYYWPGAWVADRPGMFTGSGMPMRFAHADGTIIDVYQAATQMTDESAQSYPATVTALLDAALGPQGYYGAFTANMHTDTGASPGSDAIVASAIARGVPVVSARQMLTWLDGRNGSAFKSLAWDGSALTFTVEVGIGARGLRAMLPAAVNGGALTTLTVDGVPVTFATETVKGMSYAIVPALAGAYRATYVTAPPPDTQIVSGPPATTTSTSATFQFASTPAGLPFECSLDGAAFASCGSSVTYSGLAAGGHTLAVRAMRAGVPDPTPATRAWTITLAAPDTQILSGPSGVTTSTSAAFQFASTPSGLPFECSLDGAAYAACASPRTYSGLPNGPHTFSVRAVNGGVVRDPSPATRTWTIDAQPPAISAVAAAPGLTSAVITWTTGEAGTTVVDYGTSSSALTQRASNGSLVTGHSITLNGLSQGVLYYFRVTSVDAAGNAATSPAAPESPASFRTRTSVLQSPAATVIQSGRLRSGSAGNLASDNGSTYQVNSTTSGTRTATWYASFTNVSRSLANLRISYSGSNSRTATQRIEIFRWSDGTWVTLDTRSVGSSEADLTLTPTGTLANYVSGSNGVGELRVRVRTTHSWGSFISIGDRLQISFDRP